MLLISKEYGHMVSLWTNDGITHAQSFTYIFRERGGRILVAWCLGRADQGARSLTALPVCL